jgi:nitroreductase
VDTGIAVQNLYLVATALGLWCCAVAGYCDATARQLLQTEDRELPTLLFAVAHAPERSPMTG